MTTTSLLSLGTSALFASNAQLSVTGNNIANANTPGYSRQSVQLATAGSTWEGSGYYGRGVNVTAVERAANLFLSQRAVATTSVAAADSVRSKMLGQLEKVFGTADAGLGGASTQILNAFADLAASPADLAARQAVLGRLEDFASMARSASDQIEALQANTASDVAGGVAEVNTLAAELGKLNLAIASATHRGASPNELLDQRDELVRRIAVQVQVQTVRNSDETLAVYVGSGQTLVLGGQSFALQVAKDAQDSSRVRVGISIGGASTELSTAALGEGQVAGLLRFQDSDLTEARNRLGQVVAGVGGALNAQQALGLDLDGRAGAALLSLGSPQVLPDAGNARDASGRGVAEITLEIRDPAALQASEYTLEPDPADGGLFKLTRLSDGKVHRGVAAGEVVDGFALQVGGNGAQPGDSFLLKTVSTAAADVRMLLKNPRGIAAASPAVATLGAANGGTATIAALEATAAPQAPYEAMTLRFADDQGNWTLDATDGTRLASGQWLAGSPIVYDGLALSLAGRPLEGDTIALKPTSNPAASNGNALRVDALAERGIVGGLLATDAYANLLSEMGVRVQGASARADNTATVAAQAHAELTADTGVNLDEEAARLIQFQQSYQAAAKVLQTAQTLFETLLSSVRG